MAARRFRKNERRGRASAHCPLRRPRSAQGKWPPGSRPSCGRERPGRSSHEPSRWLGIHSPTSQDSDYQKRACQGSRNGSDRWEADEGPCQHHQGNMDPAGNAGKIRRVANRNQLHFAPGDPCHRDRGESKSEMISRAWLLTRISRCISRRETCTLPKRT